MASEQQKDMEQAFEKLFVKTHGNIDVSLYCGSLRG